MPTKNKFKQMLIIHKVIVFSAITISKRWKYSYSLCLSLQNSKCCRLLGWRKLVWI